MRVCSKRYKIKDFLLFTTIYPNINMNVVKTDIPRKKPRHLPSAEANFKSYQKHQSALKLPYHSTKAVH